MSMSNIAQNQSKTHAFTVVPIQALPHRSFSNDHAFGLQAISGKKFQKNEPRAAEI
jgi:hypothetical protein